MHRLCRSQSGREINLKLKKLISLLDFGKIINPDIVLSQVEGSVVMGISVALKEEITFQDGRVSQSNYDDYRIARMKDCPDINVTIIESDEDVRGIDGARVVCFCDREALLCLIRSCLSTDRGLARGRLSTEGRPVGGEQSGVRSRQQADPSSQGADAFPALRSDRRVGLFRHSSLFGVCPSGPGLRLGVLSVERAA